MLLKMTQLEFFALLSAGDFKEHGTFLQVYAGPNCSQLGQLLLCQRLSVSIHDSPLPACNAAYFLPPCKFMSAIYIASKCSQTGYRDDVCTECLAGLLTGTGTSITDWHTGKSS